MSRTVVKISYRDLQTAKEKINSILSSHNYKNTVVNGENVWKCGIGFWTAVKYIKVEFSADNTLTISGWIKPVGGGEQSLEGFIAAMPKNQITKVIKEIQAAISY